MEMHHIVKRAIVTEKSTILKEASNQYVFEVDARANKIEIGHAIEKLFKVNVLDVKVMNMLGKKKRMGKVLGKTKSWKKAVVTLAPGSRIEVHEGV